MNCKKMIVMLAASVLAGTQCIAADANLLKNTNFDVTTAKNGKKVVASWRVNSGNIAEMVVEGSAKGKKAIKMPLVQPSKTYSFNNIGSSVWCEKGGTYVISASLMPSRKFHTVHITTYYKDQATKKLVYQSVNLKPEQYPALGKWTRITGVIKVPAKTNIGYAVEIRNRTSGEGYILIENPVCKLREE